MFYPPGKLPNAVLEKLLARRERLHQDPRVLVGPRIGEDAAVIAMQDKCLVVSSDPITFATDHLGWYGVQVNANDVAVRGARPRWFLAVLLLPERHTDDELIDGIFGEIQAACGEIDCALVGGHTEITIGLDRAILVGQMIGEVEREGLVTTGGARVGDALLLTKGVAIEGTALIARERGARLEAAGLQQEMIRRAKELLFSPGISVVRDALEATRAARVHAMHDPTEGGLATGLAELAQAAGVGLSVDMAAIPILPETTAICQALDLKPLGTLASGSLLLTVAPADALRVIEALARVQTPCVQIGRVVPRELGLTLQTVEGVVPLPVFARDEVVRALE